MSSSRKRCADRELEHLEVLSLQPGDSLVLQVPGRLSKRASELLGDRLREWLDSAGHPSVHVLVLTNGMRLGVVRGEEKRG